MQLRRIRRWHRALGMLLAVPLLVLAISGILLNHSQDLALDDTYITNPLLLRWYKINPTNSLQSISVANRWVTLVESTLYLDQHLLSENVTSLTGAVKLGDFVIASSTNTIYLADTQTNRLIEKIGAEILPEGEILSIATEKDKLFLETSSALYKTNSDLTDFVKAERKALEQVHFKTPPEHLAKQLLTNWRGKGLSLWRLTMDLHTGRILGIVGTVVLDLLGVLIVLLVLSGFLLWQKLPRR